MLDCGEQQIDENATLPNSYARVLLDWRGFPYRVVARNPLEFRLLNSADDEEYVYDYFYDDAGRILEKRSLDSNGNVEMIVRSEYDGENKIAEIGWAPNREEAPNRAPISFKSSTL
jgi:hypothetical protein